MGSRTLRWLVVFVPVAAVALVLAWVMNGRAQPSGDVVSDIAPAAPGRPSLENAVAEHARQLLEEGRRVFRFETFGDEAFWGDTLKLHQAIAGSMLGGVGPGVSPKTALSVGRSST